MEIPEGLSDLTDAERDLLAHLTVLTIQRQLKPPKSYEQVCNALASIAHDGNVKLVGNSENVWVLILERSIVHAERDWLRWMTLQLERAGSHN